MLKETRKSLRLYFGIIAAYSLFSAAAVLRGGGRPLVLVPALVNIGFAVLFAYIAFKFDELLTKSPSFIKNVLTVNFALAVIGFGLSLFGGVKVAAFVTMLIATLIYVYLLKSVTRLSAESAPHNA